MSLTPNPTPKEKAHQLGHLAQLKLEDNDLQVLVNELENFKVAYGVLIDQYNRYAESTLAAGGTPDKHPFLSQRDALVHSTRDRLQHSLSFSAMLHLDEHVQSEKHNMKVPKEEQWNRWKWFF
jgi:hypothetical protein